MLDSYIFSLKGDIYASLFAMIIMVVAVELRRKIGAAVIFVRGKKRRHGEHLTSVHYFKIKFSRMQILIYCPFILLIRQCVSVMPVHVLCYSNEPVINCLHSSCVPRIINFFLLCFVISVQRTHYFELYRRKQSAFHLKSIMNVPPALFHF